jgi:hypothetical protein
MLIKLVAGEDHVKINDGLPRKSPTSSVPMFILLNIAMAAEKKQLTSSEKSKITRWTATVSSNCYIFSRRDEQIFSGE